MHAYTISYMYANGKVLNYVYTNGRVLRYVYIYINFGSSFMCTQMVECSGMCICIFVFIFVHKTGAVLCYVSANGKGLNYLPRQTSSLWTSKLRLLGMEGLLQQWLVRVITNAYGLL